MPGSSCPEPQAGHSAKTSAPPRRSPAAAARAAVLGSILLFGQAFASGAGSLDPAFRLAVGGRALAGPVVDCAVDPPAAWLLSEDLGLYALTDAGTLAARIDLSSGRPSPFLAVDPFGRALVVLDSGGRAELAAYTRMGREAWRGPVDPTSGKPETVTPAFGSDGRAFVLSGRGLRCFNPAGLRLWDLSLPGPASCRVGVDGRGYPRIGLADGRLVAATPYGQEEGGASLGSSVVALCALPPARPSGGVYGPETPLLAAGLADGRVLLLDQGCEVLASYRAEAPVSSFAWDGSRLYCLDSSGEVFALPVVEGSVAPGRARAASGPSPSAAAPSSRASEPARLSSLWSVRTGCAGGSLRLFGDRLVATGKGSAISLSLGGELSRELSAPDGTGEPAVSPAGLAYAAGSDWILAAYRFEKRLGGPVGPVLLAYPAPPGVPRGLAFDPLAADPDRQLSRLADMHDSLESGTIGGEERDVAAYCAAVIDGSLARELPGDARLYGGSPLARAKACELLGELGSVAYRDPLFDAVADDPDPAVRAAACAALADMTADPDGRSMAAFLAASSRPVDERTAFAIVGAIEAMTLRSGRTPSGDALRALVRLTTEPYGRAVRSRAMAAIGRISGGSR